MNAHTLASLKDCLASLFNKDKPPQKKHQRGRTSLAVDLFVVLM